MITFDEDVVRPQVVENVDLISLNEVKIDLLQVQLNSSKEETSCKLKQFLGVECEEIVSPELVIPFHDLQLMEVKA